MPTRLLAAGPAGQELNGGASHALCNSKRAASVSCKKRVQSSAEPVSCESVWTRRVQQRTSQARRTPWELLAPRHRRLSRWSRDCWRLRGCALQPRLARLRSAGLWMRSSARLRRCGSTLCCSRSRHRCMARAAPGARRVRRTLVGWMSCSGVEAALRKAAERTQAHHRHG